MSGYLCLLVCMTVFCMVKLCEGGECCKKHYNLLASEQAEKWCDNYCCIQVNTKVFDCCDDVLLRAPASVREDFCLAFFSSKAWVPVLIVIGGLALIIGCCVCCCKCCCGRRNTPVIVQPPSQPNMVVMQQSSITQSQPVNNQYNAGYNQVPPSNPTDPYTTGYIQPTTYFK